MEYPKIKSYLDEFVKARIEGVLRPLMEEGSTATGAAFFAVPFAFMTLFFCYVEFLGYLYSGGEKDRRLSKNAVDFLRIYFGEADPKYKKVGGLLYHIYRHGTVHELKPKRIQLQDGTTVGWEIVSGTGQLSDPLHLTGFNLGEAVRLKVSENSLCNDLASAVDIYYKHLCTDRLLRKNFEDAVKKLRVPDTEAKIRNKNYICDSDFDFIRNLPDFAAGEER